MNCVVITGATSMLGIALINECIKRDIYVFAFVNSETTRIERIPRSKNISIIYKKLEDFYSISDINISYKPDVFYHFAWSTGKKNRNLSEIQIKNIEYTVYAVRLAKMLGCKKFVGIGSQAEFGIANRPLSPSDSTNPVNAYGIAKYAAGKLAGLECKIQQLEFNWVRVFSVYGKYDKDESLIKTLIYNVYHNIDIGLSSCEQIWDYLNERDAGYGLFLIGMKGINGKIYCLGSGRGKPLKSYVQIIINNIKPDYCPKYGAIKLSDNDVYYLVADIKELKDDTGWEPIIEFNDGIKDLLPPPPFKNLFYYFSIVMIDCRISSFVNKRRAV